LIETFVSQIPILIGIVLVGIIAIYFVKMWTQSPAYLRFRIKDRDETIKDLKHKYNVMNGKFTRIRNQEFLDEDVVQDVKGKISSDPETAINQLLDNAAPRLGKLGAIAKNPLVRKLLSDAMKKYPKESAEIAASVLPKLAEFTEATPDQSEVQRL